jgi:hypothetical protein
MYTRACAGVDSAGENRQKRSQWQPIKLGMQAMERTVSRSSVSFSHRVTQVPGRKSFTVSGSVYF